MSNGSIRKGTIVMVDVPYLDATQTVRRPALVVADTSRMLDVIIAAITSRIRNPLPSTHYVIDHSHSDWAASGLRLDSVVRCARLFTVSNASLHRTLGQLTPATMLQIDDCLKVALGIS
ncbi:MAG: type II toxin-antitoxin system PemK/MazF family toxin [Planctomycetia bacterium]|nr:type II toxin-antitoxin system PemK/MazF family toxin [Planctomycetia bacterium]